MKYNILIIFLLLSITLVGCTNRLGYDNLNVLSDNAFKYKGTWVVVSYSNISDDSYN